MSRFSAAPIEALPTVLHVRDSNGVVQEYVPLSDYEALCHAAVELCERASSLPQVRIDPLDDSVLALVIGTTVCERA